MAAAVLLLLCWLVRLSHSHSYFYPACGSMNCSRILQMSRNLDNVERSLDSIKELDENLCNVMDEAIESVNFDDLRIQFLWIDSAADDFKTQNGKQWEKIKNYTSFSNIEDSVNRYKMTVSEIEKEANDIVNYFEHSLETRVSELETMVRRSKEKGEKIRKDLAQLRKRMHRLKGETFGTIIMEQRKRADELRKDAVSHSEYENDANELFTNELGNINNRVNILLNSYSHSIFSPEILGILSIDYYETQLNRLKTRETKFKTNLETVDNQRRVLMDEISKLNEQIMENDRLIDRLKKQVSGDSKT